MWVRVTEKDMMQFNSCIDTPSCIVESCLLVSFVPSYITIIPVVNQDNLVYDEINMKALQLYDIHLIRARQQWLDRI